MENRKTAIAGVAGGIIGYLLRRPKKVIGTISVDRVNVEPSIVTYEGMVTITVTVISNVAEEVDVACQVANDILFQDVFLQIGENEIVFTYQTPPDQVIFTYNITAAVFAAHTSFMTGGG